MKRPDSHIKQTESFAYLESTLSEWALNRLSEDYAIDYDIQIFESGEGTNLNFGAQIKATDSPDVDGTYYKFNLETKYIDYLFKQKRPMLLVVYDSCSKNAFWVVIQDYVWDVLNKENSNWLNQASSTIKIPLRNILTEKDEIKKAVKKCYDRIVVDSFYNLSFSDGLGLNETLEDIEKLKKYEKTAEYRLGMSKILLAQKLAISGDYESVFKKLNEVYEQKKNDSTHLRSIIGLIAYSNIADETENKQVIELAEEGFKLAEELDEKVAYAILLLYRAQAIHFIIIKRITETLYAKKVMGAVGLNLLMEVESDKRLKELSDMLYKISLEVRDGLKTFIDKKNYYLLTFSLTISLNMSTNMISQFKVFVDEKHFSSEIESKNILSEHLMNLIKVFNDEELELYIRESVANYTYYTKGGEEGLKIIEPALIIANKREDKPQIKKVEFLINMMKTQPDPYQKSERKFEDLSTKEYTELTKNHIRLMGEDLTDGSPTSEALNWGLKDMNPAQYLKYCEELYVHYAGTSFLGQMTGVPSIGYKLLWCRHGGVVLDKHLDLAFETYQNKYCKNCKYRKPRDDKWICKVGWFRDREVPKAIKDFEENMKKW